MNVSAQAHSRCDRGRAKASLRSRTAVVITMLCLVACEFPITRGTERAWQEQWPELLIRGHTDFKGLDVDSDTGFYVFRYQVPSTFNMTQAVQVIRDQIAARNTCFKPLLQTAAELQMRCETRTFDKPGFDEYRVLVDTDRRRVTAMFGNFDSAAEQRSYTLFVKGFRAAHQSQ